MARSIFMLRSRYGQLLCCALRRLMLGLQYSASTPMRFIRVRTRRRESPVPIGAAGEAKTDARDAAIIAETVRSMPHTLRSRRLADEQLAELTMLCGFDDDLAAQVTQTSNRIPACRESASGPPPDS